MKAILDLTGTHTNYSDTTNITYNVSKFPDGQQTVDITSTYFFNTSTQVQIRSRMNDFKELELILCATQALKNLGVGDIELYVPYFIGGRSDRLFGYGGVNYLKQVIGPIINSQGYSTVYVMDPHSDVLEAVINNFSKVDNFKLVKFALERIDNKNDAQSRICLVSPDAGAYKKIFDVAKEFGIQNIITANKVRDLKTGNILRTELPNLPVNVGGGEFKYVIIDDICDGGRTFVEIAKVIKEQRPNAKVYLVVTHGIFSAGFETLGDYFDGIFTTNSIKDISDDSVGTNSLLNPINFKQLNVF
jgi:ribose-phosphate pyrophosphokinase